MNKTIEIHTGLSGSGHTVYLAVTVDTKSGKWLHVERFDNLPQAQNWQKWA